MRIVPPLGAALMALAVTACRDDGGGRRADGPPVDILLRPYLGRLVTLEAGVGPDTVHLILDTGGGETVISPAIARHLGCTPSGRSVGFRMDGARVEFPSCPNVTLVLGGLPFVHDRIGVWDVHALLPEGVPPVDGVVSLKTLASRPFTLRLAEQRLTLETPESFRRQVAEMSRVQSRQATGADGDELTVFVRGEVNGDTAWFLVDSGNLDVVQVGPHVERNPSSGSDGTWEGALTLDDLPGIATAFRTRDIIYDGVLSEEFLRQWVLAFDLTANEVWAARLPAALDAGR